MLIERTHDVIDSGWFNILLGARFVCLFLRTGSFIIVCDEHSEKLTVS